MIITINKTNNNNNFKIFLYNRINRIIIQKIFTIKNHIIIINNNNKIKIIICLKIFLIFKNKLKMNIRLKIKMKNYNNKT